MNDMNNDAQKDPEQLEREVRAAREQLSHTVDEISDRLSPGELLDQALNASKGYGGDFARNLGQQAKDNPLALMVTGVGMAWMMLGNQQQDQPQKHTESFSTGRQSLGGFEGDDSDVNDLSRTTAHASGSTADHTSYSGNETRDERSNETLKQRLPDGPDMPDSEQIKGYAKSAQTQLQRTLAEQPLMVGALGVALGAALGALLPASDVEDRLMGEKSDEMAEKATQIAADQYKETRDTLKQKVSAAADKVDANQLTDNSETYSS